MYPLVRELAVDGIPVTVMWRVLHLARKPYYRWLLRPVSARELAEAYLAHALFDAPPRRPRVRLPAAGRRSPRRRPPGLRPAGVATVLDQRLVSVFGKGRSKAGRPGPPAHEDQVRRNFAATAPNRLCLTDITEPGTNEGRLSLCAVKDVYSGRIVGYSISDQMKARLAVNDLTSTAMRRGNVAGCLVHGDRGSQFRSRKFLAELRRHHLVGSMGQVGAAGDNAAMESFFARCRRTSSTDAAGPPGRNCGSPSSPGSNAPTTADDDKPAWVD
jgi:putative transposase